MNTYSNTIVAALILIVGFGAGYVTRGYDATQSNNYVSTSTAADHGGMDMGNTMAGMTGGLEGKSGDEFDKAFLSEMIVHHQGAVEMAQSALVNAQHQEIKDMAHAIITAQTTEIAQMKAWQKTWYNQ